MQVIRTRIPGVIVFQPKLFGDQRGFFMETYHLARYADNGLTRPFVQDNLSRSAFGVLRGLHLQNPAGQGKLVSVQRGAILDVAVDVRVGSPTFAQHVAVELNDDNRRQLWVPRGFAHGFAVQSEIADVSYKCDEFYSPDEELTIRWDDPDISIKWPIASPVLSKRDAEALFLRDVKGLPQYPLA